ncbi:MAG: ACP phosphodiesterase [Cyclobacteriaceae bacterium]|jgi:acyl carrier protein phosphodiesterase|nr:ACP phosphodiesterase [Cyclobacteriaceae bacterium]
MNFLAHLYLSGTDSDVLIGNFIGDFIKGRNALATLPPKVQHGVTLHRIIDAFTDKHSVVDKSKSRLRPKYRHYAGVIVDIFYDHFLALSWNDHSGTFLPDFAEDCYQTLEKSKHTLPEEVNFMLPYMIKGNWLVNYAQVKGIKSALTGMSRRTKYVSRMEEASEDLVIYHADFKEEFTLFFPELISVCNLYLGENGLPKIR